MFSLNDFEFDLPQELIAVEPLEKRDRSKMMVIDRVAGRYNDREFIELPNLLAEGDILVLNNTKVFPARLVGRSETGAAVEIFLTRPMDDGNWEALAKPARRLPPGKTVYFTDTFAGTVVSRGIDGRVVVKFWSEGDLEDAIDKHGRTPLPPYIKRSRDSIDEDRERYQTVYASERGAIAAPTAGLHFTAEVMEQIRLMAVNIVQITLHVGYGTFEPIRTDDLSKHSVQPERYEIDATTADALNSARESGGRIIAVGTTTTRALETNFSRYGRFQAERSIADLTILPGHEFRAIGALLTNFHLPKSSLLVLVSAFAGRELIMNAYRHAVEVRYRFYSYGDCMFIY